MSIRPTKEERKCGRDYGWSGHDIWTGYTIVDYDGTGMLEIEAIGDIGNFDRWLDEHKDIDIGTDELAALQAIEDGYCKIIPIEELPTNFKHRWFGWIDTPENRAAIIAYCEKERETK